MFLLREHLVISRINLFPMKIWKIFGINYRKHSRVKPVILKQNGIKQRYYALTKEQKITHTNAEMAVNSILQLLKNSDISNSEIELLSCATSSPDQMLPSHASMVHGLLKNKPLEIFSASGILFVMFTSI